MQPADLDALATELEEQLLGLDPTGPRVVAIGGGHGLVDSPPGSGSLPPGTSGAAFWR